MAATQITPIGALVRGMIAGALASGVQSLFFRLTSRLEPGIPTNVFQPPEEKQKHETQLDTVARRFVENLAQRGPFSDEQKQKVGTLIHYGFGARWGMLYGLLRESYPQMRSLRGVVFYSSVVWMISDNLILPVFRLAAWPNRYSWKTHTYAWSAHLVFGFAVWGSYEGLREFHQRRLGRQETSEKAVETPRLAA